MAIPHCHQESHQPCTHTFIPVLGTQHSGEDPVEEIVMNRIISIMFVLLAMGTSLIAQTTTASPSGDGSSGAPYQIGTLSNLYWITQNPDKWDAYYIQTANIDASSTISWDGGAGLTPIGNSSTKFTGWYDGDGYTISNLFIKV